MAEKIAGGHAGGVVAKISDRRRRIETYVRQDPPAQIGAGGPAIAPQHAVEGLRAVIEMLIAAEHADQKVRRYPVRDAGQRVDLHALEITSGRGAIEIGAAHVDPREPAVDDRGRRRLGPRAAVAGIAKRGEAIRNALLVVIGRSEKAVEIALLRALLGVLRRGRLSVRGAPRTLFC